jgi:hypothetical protein
MPNNEEKCKYDDNAPTTETALRLDSLQRMPSLLCFRADRLFLAAKNRFE